MKYLVVVAQPVQGSLRRRDVLRGGGALASALLWGCAEAPGPVSRRSGGERVVSLSPSTTEAMFALGAGELLVGRSSACDHPREALQLPVVGGFGTPNIEVILSLRPTVVVGSRGPAGPVLIERLGRHDVEVLLPPTSSLPDVRATLVTLGARFERAQQAQAAVATMTSRMEQLSRWAKARPTVSVLLVFDGRPTYVAGPGSFPDELLKLAGVRNVMQGGGPYPVVDVEQLLRLSPEVIIDAVAPGQPGPSELPRLPGWWVLRAVKQGRVHRLRSDAALRPGPRLAKGLADIIAAIHGTVPP